MATDNIALPAVDLEKAQDPAQRLAVAKQLVDALETVGFVYLDNVDGFDSERVLNCAHWFYNLDEQEKRKLVRQTWNPDNKNQYRGFFPTQLDEDSFKEGFEVGQDWAPRAKNIRYPFFLEGNVWPEGVPGAEQFRQDMSNYYNATLKASVEILRLTCLGFGVEENWFDSMFLPDSMSTLRLLHYPTRPRDVIPAHLLDGDTIICCSAHADSGVLTLLAPFHYGGLEIQLDGHSEWMAVPHRPNSLVMNIGDMLSAISGGRLKSTRHRVIDLSVDRFSVPFFLEPSYEANVNRIMPRPAGDGTQSETRSEKAGSKPYGQWLVDKLKSQKFAEYKELLASFAT